jgi:uncharacterized protein (TIGR02599 family)
MNHRPPQAFTIIELLVGMAVAVIMLAIMFAVLNQVSLSVRTATGKMDAFQSAQSGFDIMTQRLADATLNTYYDYDSATAPTTYLRRSDLHFYIGQNGNSFLKGLVPAANANSGHSIYFQAPEGYSNGSSAYANTPGLLNACGYFIEFGPETSYWPTLFSAASNVQPRYRYRLMQTIQSTENNGIYADREGVAAELAPTWITPLNSMALPIAENIIALVIWPREDPSADPTGTLVSTDYQYNSRQGYPLPATDTAGSPAALQSEQMPPILQLTMVAIDEPSAYRLQNGTTPPAAIENALQGRFTNVSQYATDVAAIEAALVANHIRYQVLTASVTLRESKWSSGQ